MAPGADPASMSAYAGGSSQDSQRQSSRISSRVSRSRTSSNASAMQAPPSQIPRPLVPALAPAGPNLSASGRPGTSSSSTAGSHGHDSQSYTSTTTSLPQSLGGRTDRLRSRPSPSPTKRSVSGSDAPVTKAGTKGFASASAIRRIPSFSLHKAADADGSSYSLESGRATLQQSDLLPSSASRSGIPRLGDTLLRKTSPSGHRVVSDNIHDRSPGTSAAHKPSQLANQSTNTGLVASRLRPSPSENSLYTSLSSPSPSPSAMGPPSARPPSTNRPLGIERDAREGSSRDSVQQSLFHSTAAGGRGGRGPSATAATASDKAVVSRGGSAASPRHDPPSLPDLDPSLHLPLFDQNSKESRQSSESAGRSSLHDLHPDTSPQVGSRRLESHPVKTPDAKRRPDILGKLSARKPDLHLAFDKPLHQAQSQQPGSRFSAFSSAHNTPADESGGLPVRQASLRSKAGTGGSSPAPSGSTSAAATPSNELSSSLSGLGLGSLTPGGAYGGSSVSSSPVLQRNRATPAYSGTGTNLTTIPQTPERRDPSPRPTPSAYDRAGQIGIGELATPRWHFPSSSASEWSSRVTPASKAGHAAVGRLPSESPTSAHSTTMLPPLSVGRTPVTPNAPALGRQRKAEAQRHSRAISLSANNRLNVAHRSPSGPASAIRTSPSVPADRFEGLSTISSLERDFGQDPKEYIRALHEMSGGEPNSPPYSISAVSDSDSDGDEPSVVASATPKKTDSRAAALDSGSERVRPDVNIGAAQPAAMPSPRLADLAWSGEETGPFVVSATRPDPDQATTADLQTGIEAAKRSPTIDPYGISDAEYRGSFNLNSAIADLLRDDEERRQKLRAMGMESDAESSPRMSSDSKTATSRPSRELPLNKAEPSTSSPLRTSYDVAPAEGVSARGRHVSSPGQILGSPSLAAITGKHPRLASNPAGAPHQQQRANRASKRMSSVSIGHSLLRGSMPLGGAESLDSTEAAEQLRRLDGMSGRKRSSSRERPSQEFGATTRSPRTSKVGSRPSSAGRGASTSQTGPASPFGGLSKAPRAEATSSVRSPSGAGERQRSIDEPRSRRSSKTMVKPRLEDQSGTLSSPKASFDIPQVGAYMSPRVKKTTLPPLPTQPPLSTTAIGVSTAVSSPGTAATSKRASTVSVASRDSLSRDPVTPSTTASRLSTSSKNKRVSDASSHFSTSEVPTATETGDREELAGSSSGAQRTEMSIPPVPPLPKAWDMNRGFASDSFSSSADSSALQLLPAAVNAEDPATPAAPRTPVTAASSKYAPLSAGEYKNLSQERQLPARDDHMQQRDVSVDSHTKTDDKRSAEAERASTLSRGVSQSRQQSQMSAPSSISHDASTRAGRESQAGGTVKTSPMPAAEDMSPSSSKNWSSKSPAATPPSPVSVRRTPSFFRRRSDAMALAAKDATEVPASPHIGASVDSPKSQAVASGRSSRKSILGLGNLLRNSTARKSMQTSSKAEEQPLDADLTNISMDGSEKASAHPPTPTKSKILRRGSLIGRKRGKTLPSSTEPPVVPSTQLPPMQVAPLPVSPAVAPLSMDEQDAVSPQAQAPDNKRYETETNNSNNLANRIGKAADAPTSATNVQSGKDARLPASSTSRPTGTAANQGQGQVVGGIAATASSHVSSSSSRIPRPTNAIQKTVGRLVAPSTAAGGSVPGGRTADGGSLATTPHRNVKNSPNERLSGAAGGNAGGGMTKSYTMSSLASNFGIQAADEDASSLAGSEVTLNGKSSSRRLSLTGAGSSPSSHSATAPVLSTSVQLILNAYNAAKTQSDIDGVLRRARVTTYASNLSATDREVLGNLISHHETPKHSADRDKSVQATPISKAKVSDLITTPRAQRSAAAPSTGAAAGSSSAANTPASRRSRASMVATSSSARAAREDALTTSLRGGRAADLVANSPKPDGRSSSAASTVIDEDERQGDAEMEAYIRRSHAKKAAAGVSQKELDEMLRFPEPVPPSKAYSPRQAEALYSNLLSNYELQEMFEHKEIFFVGDAQTKIRAHRDRPTDNYGYDDERGDYQVIEGDHLAYRYEIMGTLGRGSFGQVLQCKDHKTGRSVAVKLIRNKKRFHHQALVEIKILQNLVDWDPEEKYNVIKMTDHFYFRNHLCISMELLSINLYELIKANSFAGFSTGLIKRFTSQVLAALSLMKQHKVVHCDLKPENILLMHPRKSGIKVIDFGSSCFEYEKVYTYIQSRFYRSPEVILGMNYHAAIDIWSLGCIMAELYTGFPLFPGENEQEQLACIMEVLGVPDRYLVERSSRKKLFFDSTGAPRPVVNSKGKRRRPGTKSLSQALKCNEDLFIDFLAKCLIWDPERRIKPDTAMRHPWIRSAAGQKVIGQGLSLTPGSHARQMSLSQREHGLQGPQAPSTTGGIRSTRATLSGGDHGSSIPSSMPRSVTGNVAGLGSGGSGAGLVSTRRTPVHSSATAGASLVGGAPSSAAALRRNQQPVS